MGKMGERETKREATYGFNTSKSRMYFLMHGLNN
jgi:hypothetical protein